MAFLRDPYPSIIRGECSIPEHVFSRDVPENPKGVVPKPGPMVRKMLVVDGYPFGSVLVYRDGQLIEPLDRYTNALEMHTYLFVAVPRGRFDCHKWVIQTDENIKPRVFAKLDGTGGYLIRELEVARVQGLPRPTCEGPMWSVAI